MVCIASLIYVLQWKSWSWFVLCREEGYVLRLQKMIESCRVNLIFIQFDIDLCLMQTIYQLSMCGEHRSKVSYTLHTINMVIEADHNFQKTLNSLRKVFDVIALTSLNVSHLLQGTTFRLDCVFTVCCNAVYLSSPVTEFTLSVCLSLLLSILACISRRESDTKFCLGSKLQIFLMLYVKVTWQCD